MGEELQATRQQLAHATEERQQMEGIVRATGERAAVRPYPTNISRHRWLSTHTPRGIKLKVYSTDTAAFPLRAGVRWRRREQVSWRRRMRG
jgi:hypothetical protein